MADHWAPGEYRSIWSDLQGVSFSQGYKDANGVRTRYLHSGADDPSNFFGLRYTIVRSN